MTFITRGSFKLKSICLSISSICSCNAFNYKLKHDVPINHSAECVFIFSPTVSRQDLPVWKQFQNEVAQYKLYSSTSPVVDRYIEELRNATIVSVETIPTLGTQIKLIVWFEDGGRAMLKPKRYSIMCGGGGGGGSIMFNSIMFKNRKTRLV